MQSYHHLYLIYTIYYWRPLQVQGKTSISGKLQCSLYT